MGCSKSSSKREVYSYTAIGKFIALQSYLKKQETSQINNITLHQLEKAEEKNPKISKDRKSVV